MTTRAGLMRERDDFMKEKMRKYAYPDSRFGEHRRYLDGGDPQS